jgi:hypothetical protein
LQPRQLRVGCSRTGLSHFGQAKVDGVGENRRQQQILVGGHFAGLEMAEVAGERADDLEGMVCGIVFCGIICAYRYAQKGIHMPDTLASSY